MINKSQGVNIQHKEHGQQYCNNFVEGQMLTRPVVIISECMQTSNPYVVHLKLI